jgi:DNA polymerase-3 subunit gamma/tau
MDKLRSVCEGEGITIEPDALELLARMADGALRDALSLLDQCSGVPPLPMADAAAGRAFMITEALVRETLGLTGLNDLADWLMEIHDLPKSMARLNALYQGGMDISAILGQLSSLLRDLLMGQMTGDLALTRLPAAQAEALSAEWPRERILDALECFSQTRLSRSGDKKLEADLCLIRLALPRTAAPAAIESGRTPVELPLEIPRPAAPAAVEGGGTHVEIPLEIPRPAASAAIGTGGTPDNPFMQEAIKQAKIQQTAKNKELDVGALEKMIASAGDLILEE